MVRTRVGYAGGSRANPTYRDLGDHSETIQIDYDPSQISYAELLEVYWESHNPTSRPWSGQYASLILYHNDDQQRLAVETRDREAASRGGQIFTQILPFSEFYLAEDYHQKYRLQQVPELAEAFRAIYPDHKDFVDSTAAARANGYVGGYGTLATLKAELGDLGLSPAATTSLVEILLAFER